ncbi:SGNH/GDSL hydrolase family protein [Jiulongibacter sp. NS-SX5]|uniref:SGNH/GDSL hydrolase family protein n=1 Tax=Jiulongibacter sp. NS-SX5 TaxID=3463854 RepID=UPI004059871C
MDRRAFLAANMGGLALQSHTDSPAKRFLFIGDSITDGNRGRNEDPNHILGHGFVFNIASQLGAEYPLNGLDFFNRGISGNTVLDLESRWDKDCISLNPEVLAVMVGINDFYFQVTENREGCTPENFEKHYLKILMEARAKNPNLKLIIMSPFLIPIKKKHGLLYDSHGNLFEEYHAAAKHVAKKTGAVFIDLQPLFLEARSPNYEYWIWDGIHPTYRGHYLIAQRWIEEVRKKFKWFRK